MKKTLFIALAAYAIALAGCKVVSEPEPVPVESVTLNATTLTLSPGATGKLTATVTPDNADDKKVVWLSSDLAVATVGEDGTVTAVGIGEATITANAGGKEAKCQVTVRQILVAVQSVALDQKTLTLTRGETGKLTATVLPENADDKTVLWSSSDASVAKVGDDGTITAVSKGTATITAQAGGIKAECAVIVHTHSYSNGKCTVCGLALPSMAGGTIDENGKLTKYTGSETAVVIPDGVTSIEREAFYGCASLASVTIPASVTRIGWGAFEGCTSLTDVTYTGTFAQWCAMSNDWYLRSYAKHVTVEGTDLKQATTLVIPDGVTGIGAAAFRGCTSLASVVIPTSVTSIGYDAFDGCAKLKVIHFNGTMAQWNAIQGVYNGMVPGISCTDGYLGIKDIPDYLTMSGTTVTGYTGEVPAEIVIPNGVTEIGWSAFKDCTSLASVTIPDSVTEIGRYAFEGCTSLVSVTIPDGVTEIGNSVFEECASLASVVIPASVTSIGYNAFDGCTSLTSVEIPGSVTSIWYEAFSRCASLESVTIGNGVTRIVESAFKDCTSLASVTIPDSVTEIGWLAFDGCTSLASVTYGGTKDKWGDIEKGYDYSHVIFNGTTQITDKDGVTFTVDHNGTITTE